MQRVFGVVVLLAGTVVTTGLGMLASRLAAHGQTEGVRAILVHGTLVPAPVLIDDGAVATALHEEMKRVEQREPLYPKERLMRRPCLVMAAFRPNSRTAGVPAGKLEPEQADLRWYYYPAVAAEPAVIGRARASRAQLEALSRLGIPVRLPDGTGAACAPAATLAEATP